MVDPRRDKALEEIARTLKSIDKSLKDISQSARHRSGRLTFKNYIEGDKDNGATTPAGSAEPGPDGTGTEPYT